MTPESLQKHEDDELTCEFTGGLMTFTDMRRRTAATWHLMYLIFCPQVVPFLGDLVCRQLPFQTEAFQDGAEETGGRT